MNIGDKVWFKGDEVTVTTEPYIQYGGEWQDAIKENGDVVCLVSEQQKSVNVAKSQADWKEQQSGFSRLRKLQS